jgi:hypothetical protein
LRSLGTSTQTDAQIYSWSVAPASRNDGKSITIGWPTACTFHAGRAPDNNMEQCLQSNSTLTQQEQERLTCGSAVFDENAKPDFSHRFQSAVNFLLIGSAIMTVVSLFTDLSSLKTLAATVILFLAKNSADRIYDTERD